MTPKCTTCSKLETSVILTRKDDLKEFYFCKDCWDTMYSGIRDEPSMKIRTSFYKLLEIGPIETQFTVKKLPAQLKEQERFKEQCLNLFN